MSGYIGNTPVPQATQTRELFTSVSGQTSFATAGYTPGYLDVYLTGVLLTPGTDYTATNGSDVVLATAPTVGSLLQVVTYTTFRVSNQAANGVFYENDQTVTADYTITSGKNAMTAGPITVQSGVTVTIPSGSNWIVL